MVLQYLKLPLTKGVLIVNSMSHDHHLLNRKGTHVPSTMYQVPSIIITYTTTCQVMTTFNVNKVIVLLVHSSLDCLERVCSQWRPIVLDNSKILLYLTWYCSRLMPWWLGNEGHMTHILHLFVLKLNFLDYIFLILIIFHNYKHKNFIKLLRKSNGKSHFSVLVKQRKTASQLSWQCISIFLTTVDFFLPTASTWTKNSSK